MSKSTVWTPSLWKDTFNELLEDEEQLDYGDIWNLNFNYNPTGKLTWEERKRGWKIYSHCAFGDFECGSCKKTWPSARVVVMFRYRLRSGRGTVIMHPFGQACRRCRDVYELPGFSQREVEEALLRLFSKIRKNCYYDDDDEEEDEDDDDDYDYDYDYEDEDEDEDEDDDEDGSPWGLTKPHEKALCEACRMGICCEDDE